MCSAVLLYWSTLVLWLLLFHYVSRLAPAAPILKTSPLDLKRTRRGGLRSWCCYLVWLGSRLSLVEGLRSENSSIVVLYSGLHMMYSALEGIPPVAKCYNGFLGAWMMSSYYKVGIQAIRHMQRCRITRWRVIEKIPCMCAIKRIPRLHSRVTDSIVVISPCLRFCQSVALSFAWARYQVLVTWLVDQYMYVKENSHQSMTGTTKIYMTVVFLVQTWHNWSFILTQKVSCN